MAAKKKATKKPQKSRIPKYVWVSFGAGGLPDGVTKLEDEAKRWLAEGLGGTARVMKYTAYEELSR